MTVANVCFTSVLFGARTLKTNQIKITTKGICRATLIPKYHIYILVNGFAKYILEDIINKTEGHDEF